MSQAITEQFVQALHMLEQQSDAAPMCTLFTDGCTLQNPLAPARRGRDGAREFWEEYRKSFGEIRSSFSETRTGEGFAVLEWTSQGTTAAGSPLQYDGVSVLTFDDTGISRFRAYFDSHPLRGRPGA